MTIDDGHRRSRSTSRDIERYAALFAERTKVMKSSAMRDLMALTERDDVISLAGGLPDTSTFPPDSYAALMRQVATESCARALQYAPTEGLEVVKRCILDVMGAEGMHGIDADEILVTTGGQQVIDLVCKTLIDPGDVIVAEAPTYPGAVPTFCAYQADVVQVEMDRDGMRVDQLEATLDRLEARGAAPEVHLHGAHLPEPGRSDDVAAAARAPGADRPGARAARARGQPVRAAALRGRAASPRCARSTAASSSSTWGRSPRSSRPASGSGGRSPRGRCWRR